MVSAFSSSTTHTRFPRSPFVLHTSGDGGFCIPPHTGLIIDIIRGSFVVNRRRQFSLQFPLVTYVHTTRVLKMTAVATTATTSLIIQVAVDGSAKRTFILTYIDGVPRAGCRQQRSYRKNVLYYSTTRQCTD